MAKHMCTDHEEPYKNLFKPQMKVGNELVSKVSNKNRANIFMQPLLVMADVENTLYRLQIKTYQL
jgi:hypothetical protein